MAVLLIGGFVWWMYRGEDTAASPAAEVPAAQVADNKANNNSDDIAGGNASPSTQRAVTAYTTTRAKEGASYVATVTLTDQGFSPRIVEIKEGESVRFINKSSKSMRIASDEYAGSPIYAGFNQVKSVGINGTYSLSFTEAGVWGYHNLDTASDMGVVYVKQQ